MCHLRAAKLIHFSPRNRPLFSFCVESRGRGREASAKAGLRAREGAK